MFIIINNRVMILQIIVVLQSYNLYFVFLVALLGKVDLFSALITNTTMDPVDYTVQVGLSVRWLDSNDIKFLKKCSIILFSTH